jgi:hypothetical protein
MKKLTYYFLIFILVNFVLADPYATFTPGKVEVTWTTVTFRVCPPGILGSNSCTYPSIQNIAEKIRDFLLEIAPFILVILIVIGGFMYLLTPFGYEKYVKAGREYIKYAIYGYVILLLIALIFTVIASVLGGPNLPTSPSP